MSIKGNIRKRISQAEGNEIFFVSDFSTDGNDVFISRLLSECVADGLIERLGNGIFYKPIKTKFGNLTPSVDAIVKAIARRDKAEVMPAGETAEHQLGLSNQVPMVYMYLTSGSARKIILDNTTIIFKRCVPKNFAYKDEFMPILVQAMKSIGKDNITSEITAKIYTLIKEHVNPETYSHDIALAPIWIKKIIRQVNV